jgi:hypothetical protein
VRMMSIACVHEPRRPRRSLRDCGHVRDGARGRSAQIFE